MAEQVNYYEVLGLQRNASQSEIKNAYRRLAKEQHPDRPGGSQERFELLQEANAVLSDSNRRRQHDEALDLAHAADQLAGLNLDFGSLDDEVSRKRREREPGGAGDGGGLGGRLRSRFRREASVDDGGRSGRGGRSANRGGGRAAGGRASRGTVQQARWYEPHEFDPEPISWKSGAFVFFGAFLAFLVVGQIGLWAVNPASAGALSSLAVLGPFMPILYTLTGIVVAYFAYRAAGWAALALAFVAALVIGGSGAPLGFVQFTVLGLGILVALIVLGNRRDRPGRR